MEHWALKLTIRNYTTCNLMDQSTTEHFF